MESSVDRSAGAYSLELLTNSPELTGRGVEAEPNCKGVRGRSGIVLLAL